MDLPQKTLLYAQASLKLGQGPAWFVSPSTACAYALRTNNKPFVFETKTDLRLVDLFDRSNIQHMLTVLSPAMQSVIAFATGYGLDYAAHRKAIRDIFGKSAVFRRHFATNHCRYAKRLELNGKVFGTDSTVFNRVAIPEYERLVASAVQTAFPWAHGYRSCTSASTWHPHQIYPAETVIFNAIDHVMYVQVLPDWHFITENIPQSAILEVTMTRPENHHAIFDVVPNPEEVAYTDETITVDDNMELMTSVLQLDNPLLTNEKIA